MLSDRIIGALTFRREVYAEVENDTTFTNTAWLIVVVVTFLNQIGANASADGFVGWLVGTILGTILTVIGFAVGAYIIAWVGQTLFSAEVTFEEMVRTLGLAYIWNIVGIFGIFGVVLSCLLAPVTIIAAILGLIAWFIAAKEALDLEWLQTIVTVILGWLAFALVGGIATLIMGALGLGASAAGSLLGS